MNRNTYISPRTDFGKPPKNYIPGAGRGAVGFTTRSDIGPARQAIVPIDRSISAQKERARQILLQRQLGVPSNNNNANGPMLPATPCALVDGIQMSEKKDHQSNTHNNNNNNNNNKETEDLNESNYDKFTGYTSNLFSADSYDDEDREADVIYSTIDKRQDSKRKRRREEREKQQWEEYHKKRPKVHEYFLAEKRQLADLQLCEWQNIPEPMDFSRRRRKFNKSSRTEKYTPVPDSIIEGAHSRDRNKNIIDDMDSKYGGWQTNTPITSSGTMTTDLTQLGRARDRHLGIQLDKMADSVTGQTVVDPKGYLTDLTSISICEDTDVSDIRKARQLLKSVITTNPSHPPGWIAASRLEEAAGKLVAARNMILRGTQNCSNSQDIWIEAARLHNISSAKKILGTAVKKIPKSVKIWLAAANLESDICDKKAVLRKALEIIPNSIILWQRAIDLEDANNARIMLSRAVECVPHSVEMWIALCKLESYENAKKVLNLAHRYCGGGEKLIFIESAKLEEMNGNLVNIPFIIAKAIKTLDANKIVINKEEWFIEAAKCENTQPINCNISCKEIIFQVMQYDEENNKLNPNNNKHKDEVENIENDNNLWLKYKKDAEEWLNKKNKRQVHVARCIYQYILSRTDKGDGWSNNEQIWWDAAQLERKYGTTEKCRNILRLACEKCSTSINLWLFAAKIEKTENNICGARSILNEAHIKNNNDKIWLALCRLELYCHKDGAEAIKIMQLARKQCNTNKIWLHSAKLLRQLNGGGCDEELNLLIIACGKYANFDKLWMMLLQCYECRKEYKKCIISAEKALKYCNSSINLWLEYIRILLLPSINKYAKARSVLQTATLTHCKQDKLWLQCAKLELFQHWNGKDIIYRNESGYQQCKSLIAKGLQHCPSSGLLYAFDIEIEPLQSKKSKCVLSIKKCPNNVFVFIQVAKYFIQIRKLKRAKEWFERAVIADELNGDAWSYYYYYYSSSDENILNRCVSAQPKYGEIWIKISKKIGNESLKIKDILLKVVKQYIEPCTGFPIQVV